MPPITSILIPISIPVRLIAEAKASEQPRIVSNIDAPPMTEIAKNVHVFLLLRMWLVALTFNVAPHARVQLTRREPVLQIIII